MIADARASDAAAHQSGQAELAATEREQARTGATINRYLAAFENGSLDPEDLADRLAQLRTRTRQLAARRDELVSQVVAEPAIPPPAVLCEVAGHIDQIMAAGSHSQRNRDANHDLVVEAEPLPMYLARSGQLSAARQATHGSPASRAPERR